MNSSNRYMRCKFIALATASTFLGCCVQSSFAMQPGAGQHPYPDANDRLDMAMDGLAPNTVDSTLTIALNSAPSIGSSIASSVATYFSSAWSSTMPMIEATVSNIQGYIYGGIVNSLPTLFEAATAATASRFPGEYAPDFGGAQRDIVSGVVSRAVNLVIYTAIYNSFNYTLTNTGRYVIALSQAGILVFPDAGRFMFQEVLKTYLINKQGFSNTNGAWMAFAGAQVLGATFTVPASYAVVYGIGAQFQKDTNARRNLLSGMNSLVTGYNQVYPQYLQDCTWTVGTPNTINAIRCRADTNSLGKYSTIYNSDLSLLMAYEDAPYWNYATVPSNTRPVALQDPYPAAVPSYTSAQFVAPLTKAFSLLMNPIAACAASQKSGAALYLKCPLNSYSNVSFSMMPSSMNSAGNVIVTESITSAATGAIQGITQFQVNQASLDTMLYN
jgi:hypothetical protein